MGERIDGNNKCIECGSEGPIKCGLIDATEELLQILNGNRDIGRLEGFSPEILRAVGGYARAHGCSYPEAFQDIFSTMMREETGVDLNPPK